MGFLWKPISAERPSTLARAGADFLQEIGPEFCKTPVNFLGQKIGPPFGAAFPIARSG